MMNDMLPDMTREQMEVLKVAGHWDGVKQALQTVFGGIIITLTWFWLLFAISSAIGLV